MVDSFQFDFGEYRSSNLLCVSRNKSLHNLLINIKFKVQTYLPGRFEGDCLARKWLPHLIAGKYLC